MSVKNDGASLSDISKEVFIAHKKKRNSYKLKNYRLKLDLEQVNEHAVKPIKGSDYAACWDLFSPCDVVVPAGKHVLIKSGWKMGWNNSSFFIKIFSRSGLAYKNGVVTTAGVIDYDYRKEVGVILRNESDVDYTVTKGDRIAQFALIEKTDAIINVVKTLPPLKSNRNDGFGSTGK